MAVLTRTGNCGIAEIKRLSGHRTPLHALQSLKESLLIGVTWPLVDGARKDFYFPFITFTAVVIDYSRKAMAKPPLTYGQDFAEFIAANDLGSTITMPDQKNWTGNTIQIWVWQPNYDNVFALLAKEAEAKEVPDADTPQVE